MSTSEIIDFAELRRITQYQHAASIERCLQKQGIRVFWGRKGVFTTRALINAAGGIGNSPADKPADTIEFEDEAR